MTYPYLMINYFKYFNYNNKAIDTIIEYTIKKESINN